MSRSPLPSLQSEKTLFGLTALVFLIAAYLATVNLDYAPLWDDEAASAIIAKNLAKRGEVSVWDGRNLMDYYSHSRFIDEDLIPRHPKMHYYLIAASYKIFGVADWSARLPGVILGLAALLLFALILRLEIPDRPSLRLLAFTLLALSPAFLLVIRQSHYYAATIFFNMLVFYFYRLHLERRQPALLFLAAAAAIAAFYTHYLIAVAFATALFIWHLLFYRHVYTRRDWAYVTAAAALFAAFVAAYMWVTGYYTGAGRTLHDPYHLRVFKLLWLNFKSLSENSFAPWPAWLFFVIAPFIAIPLPAKDKRQQKKKKRKRQYFKLMDTDADMPVIRAGVFVLLFGALIAAGSIQPTHSATWADVRYLYPIIPFCAVFCAGFVAAAGRLQILLGIILFIPLAFSNYLSYPLTQSLWYQRTPQLTLPALVAQLHGEHRDSYSETVAFLRENAADGDKILITPDFNNMPLMFYFGDRMLFCCHVRKDSPLRQVAAKLAPHSLQELNFPDWLIFFSRTGLEEHIKFFSRPTGGACQRQYTEVKDLRVPPVPIQRPEIIWHRWTPQAKESVSANNSVFVYRLQSQNCGESEFKKVLKNS